MRLKKGFYFFLIAAIIFSMAAGQAYAEKDYIIGEHTAPVIKPDPEAEYIGSSKCKMCHPDKYDDWTTSGHRYKLNTPEETKSFNSPAIPPPDGYTYDDIYMVIGGWGWKARFIDNDGYIITRTGADKSVQGLNQFNIATGTWVDYSPGQDNKKYTCGNCHTTGYSLEGNQDDKPGIVGTWEEKSIACEACHGPGSKHFEMGGGKEAAILKNDSAALCGQCHTRGMDDTKIMAKDGFIQHHEQYPEILNSPHKDLGCISCHDPHKGVREGQTNPNHGAGIKTECEKCHPKQNADFSGSMMQKKGITCVDCHMPMATKSAGIAASLYMADTRTHLFRINTDPEAEMFDETGKYANGYLTLGFACLGCHPDQDKDWASTYAKDNIHKFGKGEAPVETEETPETETTPDSPAFELLLAAAGLMGAALIRRR